MFNQQTLREYMDNPMGKGSTAIYNRKLIQSDLDNRFNKLMKKHKDFEFTIYKQKDEYFFHFLIPSESERNNKYDVVIHFTMGDDSFKYDNFLHRYFIHVFSNCPSFTYTFAHTYIENEMMIPFLKGKYDNLVVKDKPVVRNPAGIINYEKSVYFACKYLQEHSQLLNKMIINAKAEKFDANVLRANIRTSDKIMLEIKKEERRLKEEKDAEFSERKKKRDEGKKQPKSPIQPISSNRNNMNRVVKKTTASKKISAKKSTVGKR